MHATPQIAPRNDKKSAANRAVKPFDLRADCQGAVMVESAITLGVFIFVLLTGLDMMRLCANVVSSQYVASRAVREFSIGGTTVGMMKVEMIGTMAAPIGLYLTPQAITVVQPGRGMLADNEIVDESQLFSIEIRFPLKLFFGTTTYQVDAFVFGRTEPYNAN